MSIGEETLDVAKDTAEYERLLAIEYAESQTPPDGAASGYDQAEYERRRKPAMRQAIIRLNAEVMYTLLQAHMVDPKQRTLRFLNWREEESWRRPTRDILLAVEGDYLDEVPEGCVLPELGGVELAWCHVCLQEYRGDQAVMRRTWAMPNSRTFEIPPIRDLLREEIQPCRVWADPFAGNADVATLRNDLNPDTLAEYHLDALEFLGLLVVQEGVDGVLFDPPYSLTQAAQEYKNYGKDKLVPSVGNMAYWKRVKDRMASAIKPGGKAICFGWSSQGLGKGRGFVMERILLVAHGGSKNDTIVTVERKAL